MDVVSDIGGSVEVVVSCTVTALAAKDIFDALDDFLVWKPKAKFDFKITEFKSALNIL